MRRLLAIILAALCAASAEAASAAQSGDRLRWSMLRQGGAWDPYPGVQREIFEFLSQVTNVLTAPEAASVALADPALFGSPLLVWAGRQGGAPLSGEEARRLRDYLTSGGMLWIEDVSGLRSGSFDPWVRAALRAALPDAELKPLPREHVLFKTFFLVRQVAGRVRLWPQVEGLDWNGKTVVLYSRNDLLGAWARDPLGRYLFPCEPGGEAQRMDARKLTVNIIMYALTGTYKADAVHQPFLLERLRSGAP